MVGDVPGCNIGEGADGKRIAAGDAATGPRVVRKTLNKTQGRRANGAELLNMATPRSRVGVCCEYCFVLIKARQRAF